MNPAERDRLVAGLAGASCVLCFFGLERTAQGFRIAFHTALNYSSPGEVYLWLGHALLLFPGVCLLGHALARPLGDALASLWQAVGALSRRERVMGLLALALLATAAARVGRFAVLHDLPFTDDEYAVEFGARIMATGRVTAPLPLPEAALPTLGLMVKDGQVSRADWPGAQAIWAFGELTGLGPFVWAVLAAIPLIALGPLVTARLGPGWALAALAMLAASPMGLMLSLTSHAHLASRALVALAIAGYWFAERRPTLGRWTLTGLAFGLGFLCRPFETVFFAAPLLAWAAVQNLRRVPTYSRALPGLVLGGLVPVLLMLAHAYAATGDPFMPPRMTESHDVAAVSLWTRFGANLAYNAFMLAVWFLGPLGIALVAAGAMTDHFTRLLGLGVVAQLLLALFHTNVGLHSVGPIHYSECTAPLAVIAVHGLANVLRGARRHDFDPRLPASAFALALVLGLGTFNAIHAGALRQQAQIQQDIYDWIDRATRHPDNRKAAVVGPQFAAIWLQVPAMRQIGTWVFEWRRPKLDLSDDVLILMDRPGVEAWLRTHMPDRNLYRILVSPNPPYVAMQPIPSTPPAAKTP